MTLQQTKDKLKSLFVNFKETAFEEIIKIEEKYYFITKYKNIILKGDCTINLFPSELDLIDSSGIEVDSFIFWFGNVLYHTPNVNEAVELNVFSPSKQNIPLPLLGFHSYYDLANGVGKMKNNLKYAKSLGYESIGIVDYNSLAGTIEFMNDCEKLGIKPYVGVTYEFSEGKFILYANNQQGYRDLITINSWFKIDLESDISVSKTQSLLNDITIVSTSSVDPESLSVLENANIYYQFDLAVYESNQVNQKVQENIEKWFNNYRNIYKGVIINQSYVKKSNQSYQQKHLNRIADKTTIDIHEFNHMPTFEEIAKRFFELTEHSEKSKAFLVELVKNTNELTTNLKYTIDYSPKLPKYKMEEEDYLIADNTKDLFFALLKKGMQKKVINKGINPEPYLKRLKEEELPLIVGNGLVDFFLITALDISGIVAKNGGVKPPGRGSAAGCLVSYLLDIVTTDPVKYDLYFSRFLNRARVEKKIKEEVIIIETSEEIKELKPDDMCFVKRESKTLHIKVNEIRIGDKIIRYEQRV